MRRTFWLAIMVVTMVCTHPSTYQSVCAQEAQTETPPPREERPQFQEEPVLDLTQTPVEEQSEGEVPVLPPISRPLRNQPVTDAPLWAQVGSYQDPKGRFELEYDESDSLLSREKIIARIERALEVHELDSQMGPLELEEPIRIVVGDIKLSAPIGREVSGAAIGAVTTIESSRITIKVPTGEASEQTFRHELCHAHMFSEGYLNVPYWFSEGYAHLYETKTEYNHSMHRWLMYEGVLSAERMQEPHSSNNDSMRRRATGWAICLYYHHHLGESWRQVARRKSHVDPVVAWAWVRDYFAERDLSDQISRLKSSNRRVPGDLESDLAEVRSRLEEAEQVRLGELPARVLR